MVLLSYPSSPPDKARASCDMLQSCGDAGQINTQMAGVWWTLFCTRNPLLDLASWSGPAQGRPWSGQGCCRSGAGRGRALAQHRPWKQRRLGRGCWQCCGRAEQGEEGKEPATEPCTSLSTVSIHPQSPVKALGQEASSCFALTLLEAQCHFSPEIS